MMAKEIVAIWNYSCATTGYSNYDVQKMSRRKVIVGRIP